MDGSDSIPSWPALQRYKALEKQPSYTHSRLQASLCYNKKTRKLEMTVCGARNLATRPQPGHAWQYPCSYVAVYILHKSR